MEEVDIDGRSGLLGPVSLSYEFGSFPRYLIPPHIRWDEKKEPKYTTLQEFFFDKKTSPEEQGIRHRFHTVPLCMVDLDSTKFALAPETTRELLKRLSQKSLNKYNSEWVCFF
ncbi:PREDICTED: uncharacterized protein LOC104714677 [Camelina sativa]|uniref:Uncharacterized protein LOC104714677 n=1 Tax=Camelina sativa TaxID=90675 RepID=A0ABM1QF13_CAMSA|nr:PREDICTED: uncharacterized protein LOC104714677 [Camelina sativa]